jgi:hypothetical protein
MDDRVLPMRAAKVGFENDLYAVTSPVVWRPPADTRTSSIDDLVSGYEPDLPAALDVLDTGRVPSLTTWLRVLVPYVAGLFIRGPEFKARFESRPVVAAVDVIYPDNTAGARLIEFERLLAPVMCARWIVLSNAGQVDFIINDLGLTPTKDLSNDQIGFAIPISRRSVLGVFPRKVGCVATYAEGAWSPSISFGTVSSNDVEQLNVHVARAAQRWVIGSSKRLVTNVLSEMRPDELDPRPFMDGWPSSHKERLAHAKEWHRLVSATADDPSPGQLPSLEEVDIEALGRGWVPPITVVLNMGAIPTGLTLKDREIWLSMSLPADFERFYRR